MVIICCGVTLVTAKNVNYSVCARVYAWIFLLFCPDNRLKLFILILRGSPKTMSNGLCWFCQFISFQFRVVPKRSNDRLGLKVELLYLGFILCRRKWIGNVYQRVLFMQFWMMVLYLAKSGLKWWVLQGLFDKKVFQTFRNLSVLSIIGLLQSILLQKNVFHKVQIISGKW